MKTFVEHHYGDYRESIVSNSLRMCGATCGGGSEVIVLESNQNHAMAKDTEICPTLPVAMGMGGGYVPMIVDTIAFDTTQITSPLNWSVPKRNDSCHPLAATAHPPSVVILCGEEEKDENCDGTCVDSAER